MYIEKLKKKKKKMGKRKNLRQKKMGKEELNVKAGGLCSFCIQPSPRRIAQTEPHCNMCICVCVYERERKRESKSEKKIQTKPARVAL